MIRGKVLSESNTGYHHGTGQSSVAAQSPRLFFGGVLPTPDAVAAKIMAKNV